jgi:subtilisin family serine protease
LPDSIVDRDPTVNGSLLIGLPDGPYNSEVHGSVNDPLEGILDSDAGHGTFIAGLIRQTCPDARILAARVMHGDGAVQEVDLLRALNRLVFRQALALRRQDASAFVDVLSLSLGYYHELPADKAMDHKLIAPLSELGRLGVAVVAAAGNDSTSRHFYPAGFAPHPLSQLPAQYAALPVLSVGALNPDRRFVALFSNDGDWVLCERPGAALISTMPVALNGSLGPIADVLLANGERRSTIDPDDFRGGFATWSGTSFAAPVLAGEIAQYLYRANALDPLTAEDAIDRSWRAVTKLVGLQRPAP